MHGCPSRLHSRTRGIQWSRGLKRLFSPGTNSTTPLRRWTRLNNDGSLLPWSPSRRLFSASLPLHPPQCSTGCSVAAGAADCTRQPSSGSVPASFATPASPTSTSPPSAALQLFEKADMFAQSRVTNYVKRLLEYAVASEQTGDTPVGGTPTSHRLRLSSTPPRRITEAERQQWSASLAAVAAVEPLWTSVLQVPADVLRNGSLCRVEVSAVGFAADEKTSYVAACMHAERCLDALNIPLFTSAQRQHQRVVQAAQEGRTAPEMDAAPMEFSSVQLPHPVLVTKVARGGPTPLRSYQPAPMNNKAERRFSSGAARGGIPRGRRSPSNFHPRYARDEFLTVTLGEMAQLQMTLFAHNRAMEDDEEEDVATATTISPDEVCLLQPKSSSASSPAALSSTPTSLAHAGSGGHESICGTSLQQRGAKALGYQLNGLIHHVDMKPHLVDETEGGVYDLVDGDPNEWWMEKEFPGPSCLYDEGAVHRVDHYFLRATERRFHEHVQLSLSEEETNIYDAERSRFCQRVHQWYTASVIVPHIGCTAIGKGVTPEVAEHLCGMHTELLLQWFGVPLYDTATLQAMYYDACLRWGRSVAPVPVDPSVQSVDLASLPKPLKQWYRNSKRRARGSDRNVMEKLLMLNRYVVSTFRQHLAEVDIFNNDQYAELLELVIPCIRSFLVAQNHPYEGAYFNFVYQKDIQYRVTIYLPLPERYGIRGGYAIGTTPATATKLCALCAVDTLCSLDAIPAVCLQQPRWQRMLEVRQGLGLLCPASYRGPGQPLALPGTYTPPHAQLRSPPAYREVPGTASRRISLHEEQWRIMLMDAGVFDVVPPRTALDDIMRECKLPSFSDVVRLLFNDYTEYAFGWTGEKRGSWQHASHYVGMQHYQGRRRVPANTFWVDLPIDRSAFGRRIAMGRCVSRIGAERMMCLHALRVIDSLGLAPWDKLSVNDLATNMYHGDTTRAYRGKEFWHNLRQRVLCADAFHSRVAEAVEAAPAIITREFPSSPSHSKESAERPTSLGTTSSSVDGRQILSPHPIMSYELALRTFQ